MTGEISNGKPKYSINKFRGFAKREPSILVDIVITLVIMFTLNLGTMEAFHITSLVTPLWAYVGTSINLQCIHDLSPDQVYSVKWYKDSREFFRFLPNEFSPATAFPTLGVKVDTAASNENNVSLNNLTLASGGVYECEISSEAPKFETVSASATITILAISFEKPRIWNVRGIYSVGDMVDINCTSAHSTPASKLTWLINGKLVDHSWLVQYRQKVYSEETISPQISLLGLKMKVDPSFFPGGILSVRCIALLGPEQLYTERWSLLVQQNTSVQVTGCSKIVTASFYLLITVFTFTLMRQDC